MTAQRKSRGGVLGFLLSAQGLPYLLTPFIPAAVLLLGALFLLLGSRTGRLRDFRPVIGLQVPYLANALFCLIGFGSDGWSDLQLGAWLVLLTVIAYLLQIILVLGPWGSRTAANS